MRARRARPGGARITITTALAVLALLAAGCGGGGGDDGPSDAAYFGSVDTFCRTVGTAAAAVSRESAAVAKDTSASKDARFGRITASLTTFADATERALSALERTGAPERFAAYQSGTTAGFRRFVETLRNTARRAEKDPTALTRLQKKLEAIELPDPPAEVTANAKACASFDPRGG